MAIVVDRAPVVPQLRKPRNWTDYRPSDNTFLDQDTGQRVTPEGAPAPDQPPTTTPDIAPLGGPPRQVTVNPEDIALKVGLAVETLGQAKTDIGNSIGSAAAQVGQDIGRHIPSLAPTEAFKSAVGEAVNPLGVHEQPSRPTPHYLPGDNYGGTPVPESQRFNVENPVEAVSKPLSGLLGMDIEALGRNPLIAGATRPQVYPGRGQSIPIAGPIDNQPMLSEIRKKIAEDNPQNPTDWLKSMWEGATQAETAAPDDLSKMARSMVTDPLNLLLDVGLDIKVAKGIADAVKSGVAKFPAGVERFGATAREVATSERGSLQSGMGFGEKPSQGGLFENLSPEGGAIPLADEASLRAQQEARDAAAKGQTQFDMQTAIGTTPERQNLTGKSLDTIIGKQPRTLDEVHAEIDRIDAELAANPTLDEATQSRYFDQIAELSDHADRLVAEATDAMQSGEYIDYPAEIEGLQAYVETSPAKDLLGLVSKKGAFTGGLPETVTPTQFQRFAGKTPYRTAEDQRRYRFGRVPLHVLTDELYSERGFASPDELEREIENVYHAQQRISDLQRQERSLAGPEAAAVSGRPAGARAPRKAQGPGGGSSEIAPPPTPPPAGEPPVRTPAEAPASLPQGELRQGFGQTLGESPKTPEELAAVARQFTYVGPRSTQKLVDEAKTVLGNEGDLTGSALRLTNTAKFGDAEVAQSQVLIRALMDHAAQNPAVADTYKTYAAQVAKHTADQLTEAGRTSQAATIWNALGEEGVVHYAQKIIDAAQELRGGGSISRALHDAEVAALTAQIKERDAQLLEGIKNVRAHSARIERTVQQAITDNTPAKTRDVLFYVRNLMAGESGAVRLSKLDTTMPPEMINELVSEAQRIAALPAGAERRAAQAALETRLTSLEVERHEAYSFTKVEKAVQAYNERLAAQDAAKVARTAQLEAQAKVRVAEQAVKAQERLASQAEKKAAQDALMLARRDLIAAQKEVRVNTLAAERAEKTRQRSEAAITYLTDAEARQAAQKVITDERAAITNLRKTVRVNGVEIPDALARSLMERAHALSSLNETDRWIASQSLLHDIQGLVPMTGLGKIVDALNLPRTLLTMWDFSAPFRQGIVLMAGHPSEFIGAFGPMFRASADFKYARELDASFHTGPWAEIFDKMRLYLAPLDYSGLSTLARREEGYASGLARFIPGAKRSEMAYVTFLNKLRSDTATSIVGGWVKSGYQYTEKDLEDIGQFINWATGRGSLPKQMNQAAPWLSAAFFAPRFAASRIELPFAGLKAGASLGAAVLGAQDAKLYSTVVAKQIGADLGKFMAAGMLPLGMIKAAELSGIPGVRVETDPRSSEFGKGTVNGIRFDFWGGEQQMVRNVVQAWREERKSSSGKVSNISRAEVLGTWLRSKASPLGGTLYDQIFNTGYQRSGYDAQALTQGTNLPSTLDAKGIANWKAWQSLAPLAMQDALAAYNQAGLPGAIVGGVASGFGIGVQSYASTRDLQDKASQALYSMDYVALQKEGRAERLRTVNDSPEVKQSIEELQQAQRIDQQEAIKYGFLSNDQYRQDKIDKFVAEYPTITNPDGKRKYIQDFKHDIAVAADATIGKLLSGTEKPNPADTAAAFATKYYALVPQWNPDTGEMDMEAWDAERQKVLAEATQAGVDPTYITEHGEKNWLKEYENPVVRDALKGYSDATKAMTPYWEIKKKALRDMPGFAKIVAAEQALRDQGKTVTTSGQLDRIHQSGVWKTWTERIKYLQLAARFNSTTGVQKAGQEWGWLNPLTSQDRDRLERLRGR